MIVVSDHMIVGGGHMMVGGCHMTGHSIFLTVHVILSGHTAVPSLVKEYSETHANTLGPSADEDICSHLRQREDSTCVWVWSSVLVNP